MSAYREMSEEERSAWRALPVTRALLDDMRSEAAAAQERAVDSAYRCNERAASEAGTFFGLALAIQLFEFSAVAPNPESTETFIDPAMRMSLRRKVKS